MDAPEVPLEQSQEEIAHHAHHATEPWIMGVALTAALLAALAAVTALLAEHHANEAMILQIRCSDQWNFYQAKSLKANLLTAKMELLAELGKKAGDKDAAKLDQYRQDQQEIKREAKISTGVGSPFAPPHPFGVQSNDVPVGHRRGGNLRIDQAQGVLVRLHGVRPGGPGAADDDPGNGRFRRSVDNRPRIA